MTDFDFTQFYSNSQNNSNFKETFTVENIKASQGNAMFRFRPCEPKFDASGQQTNKGRLYFACGQIRGSVSKALADKINTKQPFGNLLVSHVVNDGTDPKYPTPFNGLMVYEETEGQGDVLAI